MNAAARIGRVRASAVLVAAGAALALSGAAVAVAEPADSSPSSDAGAAASRPGTGRPGTRVRRPNKAPVAAASVPVSRNEHHLPSSAAPPAEQVSAPVPTEALPAAPARRTTVNQITLSPTALPAAPLAAAAMASTTATPVGMPESVAVQHVPVAPAMVPAQRVRLAAQPVGAAGTLAVLPWSTPVGPADSPLSWMVLGSSTRVLGRPRATPSAAAAIVSTGQALNPVAKQATDPITTFLNGVAALFSNQRPALHPSQTGQGANGVVTGALGATDPDSAVLSYTVTAKPAHGTVSVGGDGSYNYTPSPTLATTGTTDSFRVSVSDAASGFHVHGLAGLLNVLTFGLLGDAGHASTATVSVTVTPFNNLPTGRAVVGDPDPSTGAVTGSIIGNDLDGDALTYSGPANTAKGSVTVSSSGHFSYLPTNEAWQAATSPTATVADKQDVFSVNVDDGRGGVVAVPVTVRISLAEGLSTFCGCTLMPANTIFHADVRNLPTMPESADWVALLGGDRSATLRAAWGGTPWMGSTGGLPVNVVSATHPTEIVIFNRGYSTSGPSIDDSPYAIPDRPLVEGMPDVPAWDRHLLVFQEGTCISQELYNVANGVELPAAGIADALANAAYAAIWGSAWIAEAGVHYDMSSALYPDQGWANASKLPYLPLILRPDDLARGSIDHMLGMVIAKDKGTGYTWPARAGDGTGINPDGIPMGTVFRLRADFDISGYDPGTQVVLRALQDHGAVVYDSSAPGQDGAGLMVMSNGWTGTDYLTAQRELNTIPLSAFEAVDVLNLAIDPSTSWQIRT